MILKPNMVLTGIDLHHSGDGGRGGRRHGEVSPASRSRRCPRDCVSVGRPIRSTGLGAVERHECQVQGATGAAALGAGFFIRSSDPAPALEIWGGEEATDWRRSKLCIIGPSANRAARRGEYSAAMETPDSEPSMLQVGHPRIAKAK